MQKSIVASKNLKKGQRLVSADLAYKSPAEGLEPYKTNKILGKKLKTNLAKDDYILIRHLKR